MDDTPSPSGTQAGLEDKRLAPDGRALVWLGALGCAMTLLWAWTLTATAVDLGVNRSGPGAYWAMLMDRASWGATTVATLAWLHLFALYRQRRDARERHTILIEVTALRHQLENLLRGETPERDPGPPRVVGYLEEAPPARTRPLRRE